MSRFSLRSSQLHRCSSSTLPLLSQIRHDLSLVKLHTVRVQRAYDEKVNCTSSRFSAYPGGKSWDEVPGQTGSGKKFHRNVISGVDFTAGCSRSGAGLYVPRRTLSQGNDVIRSPPPGFDEGSYQGQSVPAPSQICHNLSLAKQHEEKVTCAS